MALTADTAKYKKETEKKLSIEASLKAAEKEIKRLGAALEQANARIAEWEAAQGKK